MLLKCLSIGSSYTWTIVFVIRVQTTVVLCSDTVNGFKGIHEMTPCNVPPCILYTSITFFFFLDIDDCSPNPCANNCTDKVNDLECSCVAGYAGKQLSLNINILKYFT